MTAAGPWSVKGIDPKARELAKDLARRSGMTLGEWLNQMIIEGEAEAPPVEAEFRRPTSRSYGVPGEPFRAPGLKSGDPSISRALDQLSKRLEAAEHRSTLAISGIDQSVTGVVSRLEAIELDHTAVAARFDGALEDARQARIKTNDKIGKIAEEDGSRSEAITALEGALNGLTETVKAGEERAFNQLEELKVDLSNTARRVDRAEAKLEDEPASIEAAVAKIADRLEQSEQRTSHAIRALEASLAGLDARLRVGGGGEPSAEGSAGRFEHLAEELAQKVEASRAEFADRLKDVTGGNPEYIEAKIADLAAQLEKGEHRSAEAIDRMGREVVRFASSLGERMIAVEGKNTQAAKHVSDEMARMADTMERRMSHQDSAQAQALEKLGGEISRIAEKLAERILNAERRSSQSIDDVGDQLGRVTERLNQRYDRAQTELGERIRQSEERTAKLLGDAQSKIDARLQEAKSRTALETAAEVARQQAEAEAEAELASPKAIVQEPEAEDPFSRAPFSSAPPPPTFTSDPFADPASLFVSEPSSRFVTEPSSLFVTDHLHGGHQGEPSAPFAGEPAAHFSEAALEEEPLEDLAEPISGFAAHSTSPFDAEDDGFHEEEALAASHEEHEPALLSEPELEPAKAEGLAAELFGHGHSPTEAVAEDHIFSETHDGFDPIEDLVAPHAQEPISAASFAPEPDSRPLTTREIMEQARMSMRTAAPGNETRGRRAQGDMTPLGSVEAPAFEGEGGRFSFFRRKKKDGVTIRTALLASGTAAALAVTGAGAVLLVNSEMSSNSDHPADHFGVAPTAVAQNDATPPQSAPAPTAASTPAPVPAAAAPVGDQVAVALTPSATDPDLAQTASSQGAGAPILDPAHNQAGNGAAAQTLYSSAVRRIESNDFGGVEDLKRSANLGNAPAEFYLAKLYETGGAGLTRDLVVARRWTERAAAGGDIAAMHNLGLYYYEGEGGTQDSTQAARWFLRAAEQGVRDSQYNLALLYAKGTGVPQNMAEAYKWYLIAAADGDDGARAAARTVRAQLTPESQSAAERSAAAFHAQTQTSVRTAGL